MSLHGLRRLVSSFSLAIYTLAQTTGTATFTGAVSDPTGLAISGAVVSATNTQAQFVTRTTTTAEGTYYLPYLNAGTYLLTIQAP